MKTFDLTENELRAALLLVSDCLDGMGGERPSDLEQDEYTWCDAGTLIGAGWSRHAAAGTFSSLADKGIIQIDKEGDFMTTDAWMWLDTVWDENREYVKAYRDAGILS